MRLTLRTLLAYLDDILDPADKEELTQKIESSEFAKDLMHRSRDTMRRLRLSAPQVVGTGMGLDPNTVAEYLDNVLPPDQVGDFERICLESDVHLAEAAACHHVLTMVLGEPADVEPRARQRMYGIPNEARERKQFRAERAHPAAARGEVTSSAASLTPSSAMGSHQPTATMEIPEYLRTGAWWRSRGLLAALAAALLVGATVYLASGLMGWFGGTPAVSALDTEKATIEPTIPPVVAEVPDDTAASQAGDAPAGSVGMESSPSTATSSEPDRYAQPSAISAPPLATPPQPLTPGITTPLPAATIAPDEAPDRYAIPSGTSAAPVGQDATSLSTNPAAPPIEAPALAVVPEAEVAGAGVGPALSSPYDVPPAGETTGAIPPVSTTPPTETTPLPLPPPPRAVGDDSARLAAATPPQPSTVVPGAIAEPPVEEDVPAGPPELGTYMGGKTVLVRHDDASGSWFRVEPRAAVIAGQRLLALPEFRPKITLASGIHLDLTGGTQVVAIDDNAASGAGPDFAAAGVPTIDLVYGRLVLINTSNAEQELRVKLGLIVGDARLARNATLAIELEPQYVPGNDPRQTPAPLMVRLYAPDGGVVWHDMAGEKTADTASRWSITDGKASEVAADAAPPEWIDQEPIVQLSEQRYGAPVVESTLVSDRPVDTQLLELFQGSGRKEVKSLVARSSIHVGLFEPFVDALRDSEQKANWRTHIEALRSAMALSPVSAESVRQALVEQRGPQAAADLYEMLCGYNAAEIGTTPEQVKTGALARLIDWLEDDSLDYRVLAVHNLREITGKQLMPNPAANLVVRKQNVRNWRRRLESGELRPVAKAE